MTSYPGLLNHYLKFCHLRNHHENGVLDLGKYPFYYPITLLPILNLIAKDSIEYIPHYNPAVQTYISIVNNPASYSVGKSYVPVAQLPDGREDLDDVLQRIIHLFKEYGSLDAFIYAIYELSENIYEHSEFNTAHIMAQRYANFVDICILDDGITIPKRINKNYEKFRGEPDYKSIAEALNGLSTKGEKGRGYGLKSSINLFSQGLNAKILIISRFGASYIDKNGPQYYKLKDYHKWDGTIIGIRVPFPIPKIDIYQYIK